MTTPDEPPSDSPPGLTDARSGFRRDEGHGPMMDVENIAQTVLLMATLPEDVNMLKAIVIPNEQLYIGRG